MKISQMVSQLVSKIHWENDGGGYIIEKIRGIPASKLYSDGLLNKDNLIEIIASIEEFIPLHILKLWKIQ